MVSRKKKPLKGPNNSYLLSFGDTMTTLLAFFIVLNSLADEQTGANLYEGTGSFVRALESLGIQGALPNKRQQTSVPLAAGMPTYVVPSDRDQPLDTPIVGPDDIDDTQRVHDRERDEFERFINELTKLSELEESSGVRGEAVFDYFDRLANSRPVLDPTYRRALGHVMPLLFDPRHRVEVTVWATTPAPSALERAARKAHDVGLEIVDLGQLSEVEKARLTTTTRVWIDSKARRPVISVVVRKLGER